MESQALYTLVVLAVAGAVGLSVFLLLRAYFQRRDRVQRVTRAVTSLLDPQQAETEAQGTAQLDRLARHETRPDMATKLLRAGFFGSAALVRFQILRALGSVLALGLVGGGMLAAGIDKIAAVALLAGIAGGVVFLVAGLVVDKLAALNEKRFRRMFPDFLDLLIVCVDAGLGVEAAVARVAEEFTVNRSLFGQYVYLMALELRAGRQIDEAFQNFAKRTGVTQAGELAVLFRQSQELGTSIITSLRAFSHQMRQMRMIRAEENANLLPVKMLVPLAGFLFPVNLMIVLVPVMIRILSMFVDLAPGGRP